MKGNLNYNPYFPGARNLYDGLVEYPDGTPANASQMAKDVTIFLSWAAEPDMEDRRKAGIQATLITAGIVGVLWYLKRHKWSYFKSKTYVQTMDHEKEYFSEKWI